MQVSKEKICKCGHSRLDHKENPESKLSIPFQCGKCKCGSYMNRKLPNKTSKFALIYGIVWSGFLAGTLIIGSIIISYYDPTYWIKKDVTNGEAWALIGCICLFAIVLVAYPLMIRTFFHEKKRKEYPIE